jgi:hypothetical protein
MPQFFWNKAFFLLLLFFVAAAFLFFTGQWAQSVHSLLSYSSVLFLVSWQLFPCFLMSAATV